MQKRCLPSDLVAPGLFQEGFLTRGFRTLSDQSLLVERSDERSNLEEPETTQSLPVSSPLQWYAFRSNARPRLRLQRTIWECGSVQSTSVSRCYVSKDSLRLTGFLQPRQDTASQSGC